MGSRLRDVGFPRETLLVLVEREGGALVPEGETEFRAGDRPTFLGSEAGIDQLRSPYPAAH